ncbi:MAG: DegT/DnrJ/EryC1/StrS family aminotransferase [Patescibacteria group bacterium]|jgi:perosamine synthetase
MITMFWPYMPEEAIKAVSEVLRTRWIGQGPKVDEVENKFSRKFTIPHSVTVYSGTGALHLALRLANVGPGDEVITTPMTCTASNIPILYSGSKAVFADIQKKTMNIDPIDIRQKITPKTKAIMVVHWAGYPCDMAEINAIAKEYNLKVIEDAAHALGAKYQGQYIGAVSDYSCFSFQAIKQITTIDGGMLTMKAEADYKRAKVLRWYGIDREFKGDIYWKYQIKEIGYKYHMNDVAATILDIQLDKLGEVLARRKQIADRYLSELKNVSGLTLLERKSDRESGNWLFTLQVEKRDDFQKKLADNEIESHMVHVRNDICPIFAGQRLDLPVMNEVEDKYISIPLHNHLTDDDVEKIIKTIKSGW